MACGCFQPGRAGHGCCAVLRPGAGQGRHHPRPSPNLPMDLDGFFLPPVQAARCPPQLTVTHHSLHWSFYSYRELSEGGRSLVLPSFGKLFFLRPGAHGWCHGAMSEFPFPSGLFPGMFTALPLLGGRFSSLTPGSSSLLLLPPINASLP